MCLENTVVQWYLSQRHINTPGLESVQDFLIKLDMKPCTYASSGNKHFFTKSCHRQTYQHYEQPPRTSQNSLMHTWFHVLIASELVKLYEKRILFQKWFSSDLDFPRYFASTYSQ